MNNHPLTSLRRVPPSTIFSFFNIENQSEKLNHKNIDYEKN